MEHLDITSSPANGPARPVGRAIARGLAGRCPACGIGPLYATYLNVAHACPQCGEALHHHRADDAPAYFVMLIVGHLIIGGVLTLEQAFAPAEWVHLAVWLPMTVGLSVWLLPRVKGALIAVQWANFMHGFSRLEQPDSR